MKSIPKKPQHGASIKTLVPVLSQLIDYVRAITPRPSPSVRVSTISSGTTFHSASVSRSGGGGKSAWSGVVVFLGETLWDFSMEDAEPGGTPLERGLADGIQGIYLWIDIATGDYAWSDAIDRDPRLENAYRVGAVVGGDGSELDPYRYVLASGGVVGDIRIDLAPYVPPPLDDDEEEEESP